MSLAHDGLRNESNRIPQKHITKTNKEKLLKSYDEVTRTTTDKNTHIFELSLCEL